MKFILTALLFLSGSPRLFAQTTPEVTILLEQMRTAADLETQLHALQAIATSLDPRIPAACLPLLQSPGDSIRRNAARAIGSRWHQIPQNQLPSYVAAIKANAHTDDRSLLNMTHRGLGLLERNYDGEMFSRSHSRRWVIYERRGKPCLIDTKNKTEELLGPKVDIFFFPALGNQTIKGSCLWHSKQDMVALQMLVFRRPREVWVWRNPGGLRQITTGELALVLKPAQGEVLTHSGFSTDFKSWEGDELDLTVEHSVRIDEEVTDHTATVRWNPATDKLRVVTDKINQ